MKYAPVALLLAGCASTGAVPIGPDTFMISKSSATGYASGGEVTADLYKEANAYCAGRGQQLMPVNVQSRDGQPGYALANAKLEFRCLNADDPQLQRPNLRPGPDLRIEQTIIRK